MPRENMQLRIDLTKEYGLVLEGGGAKGAYQIGVWKALHEAGVKIKGIAGTSVGALNGSLILMGDVGNAVQLWENLKYSSIMNVDDNVYEEIFGKYMKYGYYPAIIKELIKELSEGGVDITPLRELITDNISKEVIANSNIELYIQTYSVTDRKEMDIDLRKVDPDLMIDLLLAASYLPNFKKNEIAGKKLIDAGMFNLLPLDSLVSKGYENIIEVRIFGIGHKKKIKIPNHVMVYEIAPSVELGGVLEFDGKKSKRNILIGYYDAMRFLYGLQGNIYYIDSDVNESVCFERLLQAGLDYLNGQDVNFDSPFRYVLDNMLATYAQELRLKKDWNYKELYFGIIEATLKILKVQKYKIYSEHNLIDEIQKKKQMLSCDTIEKLPQFSKMIMYNMHMQ